MLLLIRGIFCAPFVLLTIRVFLGCAGLCCYFFGVFLRTPFVLFIIRVFLGALVCVVNSSGYFCAPFVLLLIRVFWVRWYVLLLLLGIFCALVCFAYRYTKIFKTAQKLNALPVPCYAGLCFSGVVF